MTHAFAKAIHALARREAVALIDFRTKQRPSNVTREHIKTFGASQGVTVKVTVSPHAIEIYGDCPDQSGLRASLA
jgi:hypothetical protein